MKQVRDQKLQEDEKANQVAMERAMREEAARKLALQSSSNSSNINSNNSNSSNTNSLKGFAAVAVMQTGRFGLPHYSFQTEHNDERNGNITKVWLSFTFAQMEDGTRPLHR